MKPVFLFFFCLAATLPAAAQNRQPEAVLRFDEAVCEELAEPAADNSATLYSQRMVEAHGLGDFYCNRHHQDSLSHTGWDYVSVLCRFFVSGQNCRFIAFM